MKDISESAIGNRLETNAYHAGIKKDRIRHGVITRFEAFQYRVREPNCILSVLNVLEKVPPVQIEAHEARDGHRVHQRHQGFT